MNIGIGISLANYRPVPTAPLEDPDAAIAALFGSGEVGAWYDPSDSTTVFQDATGKTPAAVGDPVGLILDKSQGLTLGSELVTNGTFDADTTGTTPATWKTNNANASLIKQADGTALFTSTSFAYALLEPANYIPLTAGKFYRVSFTVSDWVAGLTLVHVGIGTSGNIITGNGSYSYIYAAPSTASVDLQMRPNGGGTGSFKIDNISVRELPGNHATQTTSAARPVLQQSGDLYYLDFDGVDDWMVASYGSTLANITRAAGYRMDTVGRFFADDDGDVNYASMAILTDGNLRWGVNGAGGANSIVGTGGWNIGADGVVVATASSGSALTLQGTGTSASGTSTSAPANITGATIGAAATGLLEMNGRIYGFIDIDRVLDAAEIISVETYLAAKSGVTL